MSSPAQQSLTSPDLCEFLDWDSRFFGLRIGRITGNNLSAAHVPAILAWAQGQSLDCLYFLADIEAESIRIAEEHAFHLVDLRMTLEICPRPPAGGPGDYEHVHPARPEDIAALRMIAGANHTDSRFYQDGHFPEALCQEFYRVWIEKSCRGDADLVLVAEHQGSPAGYITCHLAGDEGHIGLAGVASEARGGGLGHELLQAALTWFAEQRATRVTVVTQGANRRAQRLYQAHGLVTSSLQLWYHLWFPKKHR